MAVTTIHAHPAPLARLGHALVRAAELIGSMSAAARCGREVERLMALSDAELAARGLSRDRIVHHVLARFMI
jgi:hypothetical protein